MAVARVDREATTLTTCLVPACDGGVLFEALPKGRYRSSRCEACDGTGMMGPEQVRAWRDAQKKG